MIVFRMAPPPLHIPPRVLPKRGPVKVPRSGRLYHRGVFLEGALFRRLLFLPVPGGNCEDEADYGEDEKHPLDEVLIGHQDVERLGGNGKDDAKRAQYPPTLQHPHLPSYGSWEDTISPVRR